MSTIGHGLPTSAPSDMLDLAAFMLERHNARDAGTPDLLEVTGVMQSGTATATGLNDYDYQNLSNLTMGLKQLQQIQTVNKIPIPAEILDHFKHIKCHCTMGLFPEIGRAWLTIDSEIYIWTYEQTRDVAYYDGLNQMIVSVGLVKPREDIFINEVKYLLVLTTALETVVLGVTFGDSTKTISSPRRNLQGIVTFEEMQLMSKPIFVLSNDNIPMNVVQGTADGRIFLGGRNGHLYEIQYKPESRWFGRRCKKVDHSANIFSYIVPGLMKMFAEIDPIQSIVVDNSRQYLYVLTEKGAIEAWYMGSPGGFSMTQIARVSPGEVARAAFEIVSTVDESLFKNIASICPLELEDHPYLHLLAVTQSGTRLYFSITGAPQRMTNATQAMQNTQLQQQTFSPMPQFSPQRIQDSSLLDSQNPAASPTQAQQGTVEKPRGLFLLHVRLPPGHAPNATSRPKQVRAAFYKEGTTLLVSALQPDQELLWAISSSPFPNRPYLVECSTVIPLDGVIWGIAEMRQKYRVQLQSVLKRDKSPKKVVLLTNQGAHIISILKPVDLLQQLLLACQGPHHDAVKTFFQAQTEVEACATCLLLACSEQHRGTDLALWATQAFMLYGGEPCLQSEFMMNQMGMMNQRGASQIDGHFGGRGMQMSGGVGGAPDRNPGQMFMSTPMPNAPNSPICRPMMRTPMQSPSAQQSFPLSPIHNRSSFGVPAANVTSMHHATDFNKVIFSAKHDGMYLQVARLLRPIWKLPCLNKDFNSSLSQADCALLLEELLGIKSFLENTTGGELSCSMRSFAQQPGMTNSLGHLMQSHTPLDSRNLSEQAQAEERRSLMALSQFIKHMCEMLGMWKTLCEHHFDLLIQQLPPADRESLATYSFQELCLSRMDLCATLVVTLVNCYLNDNASVSAISAKLRSVCPNIFRHEDAVTFKATEILMSAKNCPSAVEKEEKLRTALQLCKDAGLNLPVPTICQQFCLVGFYEGVIELAHCVASKIDPKEVGIHYYTSNEPNEDREGYTAYASRMGIYQEVKNMLDHAQQSFCNNNIPPSDYPLPEAVNVHELSLNVKIMKIVEIAMRIKDPLLHVVVYEWLLNHHMFSELLALSEPSLGEFLRRNVVRSPENYVLIDLLWKYYEKNGHHSQAAKILDTLASLRSANVTLEQRIEYLARAVMCMRNENIGYSMANGVLLKELEDKLEIARVQKTILDHISGLTSRNPNAVNAQKELNSALFTISELYQDYAEPFDLWECKLTILNCSHHNDPILIETVWSNILNNALEGAHSTNERCVRLFTKVESLYKQFGESGNCFPLAYLIRELEVKACQLRFPEGIVPEKLAAMNLDIELVMGYYSRMLSMKERVWASEGNEWHLIQSVIRLIDFMMTSPQSNWYRAKRRIVGKAQDIVSSCLNCCYQKPGTEHLQQQLKELQCRLQRCLS